MITCPRCGDQLRPGLDYGHRHVCEDPWVYTHAGMPNTPESGLRAIRVEYCTDQFRTIPVPIDIGSAPQGSILGQPPLDRPDVQDRVSSSPLPEQPSSRDEEARERLEKQRDELLEAIDGIKGIALDATPTYRATVQEGAFNIAAKIEAEKPKTTSGGER